MVSSDDSERDSDSDEDELSAEGNSRAHGEVLKSPITHDPDPRSVQKVLDGPYIARPVQDIVKTLSGRSKHARGFVSHREIVLASKEQYYVVSFFYFLCVMVSFWFASPLCCFSQILLSAIFFHTLSLELIRSYSQRLEHSTTPKLISFTRSTG